MVETNLYFVVSDIHGHDALFEKALADAGYDPENPRHVVIILGDCFDRGSENRKVLRRIESLPRKILVRGNHEDMLAKVLETRRIDRTDIYNGVTETVAEFFGEDNIGREGQIRMGRTVRDRLIRFLSSAVDYVATDHYLFVHGWVPLDRRGEETEPYTDLDGATYEDWQEARFLGWHRALAAGLMPGTDKMLVCGHRTAAFGAQFDPSRSPDDSTPFYYEGMIAIDALTVRSGRVNVIVLEDSAPRVTTHTVPVTKDAFDRILIGEKTVEFFLDGTLSQAMTVGDKLCFTTREGDTVTATAVGCYRYPDVEAMCSDFSFLELGFGPYVYAFPRQDAMYRRFAVSQKEVLAVRFSVLSCDL